MLIVTRDLPLSVPVVFLCVRNFLIDIVEGLNIEDNTVHQFCKKLAYVLTGHNTGHAYVFVVCCYPAFQVVTVSTYDTAVALFVPL